MVNKRVKQKLKKIKNLLLKENISWKKMILFGSCVNGTDRPDSDLDMALILEEKNEEQIEQIWTRANLVLAKAGILVDLLIFNKKIFDKDNASPIIHQIKKYGLVIS
jgi:predicted nucleotidyltransferase